MFKQKFTTRTLTTLAMLIAIEVILSRFLSINAWNIKIGFGFVPVVIAAILYGPLAGGIVGALSDFIGALLFPIGTYFPGFTLTSFLMGMIFGLFLYKKQGWLQGLAAVGINQFILGLFLNTFWISVLYGSPYVPLLATRVFQSILLTVVQLICIQLMVPILNRYGKKVSCLMTPQEAISYIENYTWSTTRLGLGRTRALLHAIGDPQKQLKFIHVAGSNGKGSTCAMLDAILRAAGYRTGLYTSPYIQDFCERMQVNGRNISGDDLARITEQVRIHADAMEDHPSQFELVTAIAMQYFLEERCDIVVLEVGMGGALDSTNVIDCPEVAVITNIGLEHTEYLGNTLSLIAEAKGGIIKPGCTAVLYDSEAETMETLLRICREQIGSVSDLPRARSAESRP